MSTFCGLMEEYRSISIDRFDGINLQSTVYMLSHNHKDHTKGLDSSAFQYRLCSNFRFKLYCSEVTRDLLILSPTYRPIEKSIILFSAVSDDCMQAMNDLLDEFSGAVALPIDNPQVIKIPQGNDYGSENEEEEVTVTLIQAGHCPGSVMFLIDGSEGRVLYTGDFRLSHEELMSFDIMREMGGALSTSNVEASSTCTRSGGLRSLYVDTTFCVPEAAYIPRREETTEAALAVVSDWIALCPKHIVLLKCGADIGYENLFMRISEACSMKIHVDMKKFNQCRVLSGMLDCITDDPSLTQIHACKWRERRVQRIIKTMGPRLPCGYEDPSGELKLRTVIFSTMFFVQTVDMDSYIRRVGESTFRICYSFHPSYSEVRDLIVSLRPERAFPNVIPAYEHTGMTMQDRLNEFVALSHSISNKIAENTQPSDSQSSEVQTLGTLKSSKSLQNIFHRGTITGRKGSNVSIRRRHRKKKAFGLNKSFPESEAIPKVRASFVFGDSQASERNYISSSSSLSSNIPSLEVPLVSSVGERTVKVEREPKPLNSESFEVGGNLSAIPEENVKTEITTELKLNKKVDLKCKTEVENNKNSDNFSSIKTPNVNASTNVADSIFSTKNSVNIKSDAEVSDIESKLLAHKLWAKSSHSTASSSNDTAANISTAGVELYHTRKSSDVEKSNDSRVIVNDRESMVSNSISSSKNTSHCVSNGKGKNTSHSINNFMCNAASCSTNNFENCDTVGKSTEDVLISKCEPVIIHQSDQKIENQTDENNCQHQVSENVCNINEEIELCIENEIRDNFPSYSDIEANPSANQTVTSISSSRDDVRDVANTKMSNFKNSLNINSDVVCGTSTPRIVNTSNNRQDFNVSNLITGDRELENNSVVCSTAKITPERRSVNRYDTPQLKSDQICSKINNTRSSESVADNFYTNIHPMLDTKQTLSTSVSETNENDKSENDKGTITRDNDAQFQYSEVVGENCAPNGTDVVKSKEPVICEPSSSRTPCAFEVDDDVVLISCSSLSNNQENSSSVGLNNKCVNNVSKNVQYTNGKARVRRHADGKDSYRSNVNNEDIEDIDVARKVRKLQTNHNSGKNSESILLKKSVNLLEYDEVEEDSDDEPNEIAFAKVNISISAKNKTFSYIEDSLANPTTFPISYSTEKPTISSIANGQLISSELNSRRSDKFYNNTSIHGSTSDTALLDAYSRTNNTPYSQEYYKKEELSDKIKTYPILRRNNSDSKRGMQRLIRTNSGSPKIGPPADEVVVDLCGRNMKIQPVPEQWLCSKKPTSASKPKRAAEINIEKSGKFCKDKDVIIIEESPQKSTTGNVFINDFNNISEKCSRRTDDVAVHDNNIIDKIEISKPADELTSRIEHATSASRSSENEILLLQEKTSHNIESSTVAFQSETRNDLREDKRNNVMINDLASSIITTATTASVLSPLLSHDGVKRISSTVNDDIKVLKTPCKPVGNNVISPLYEIILSSSGSSNATTIGDGRDFSPQLSSLSPAAKFSQTSHESIPNVNSPQSKHSSTSLHRTGSAIERDFILNDSSLRKVAVISNSNSRPILTNDSEIVAPSNNIIISNCNGRPNSRSEISTNSEVLETNNNSSSEEIISCSLDSSLGTNESYSNSGSLFSD